METLTHPDTSEAAAAPPGSWAWFCAWALVGAGLALGIAGALTIGVFVLPIAILAAVLLLVRQASQPASRRSFSSVWGALSGVGLPMLVALAFVMFGALGEDCADPRYVQSLPVGSDVRHCGELPTVWPYVAVALLFVATGAAAHGASLRHRARSRARTRERTTAGLPVVPTNSLAVVSLVTGIMSMIVSPPAAVVGLVTGIMARKEIRRAPGTQAGDRLALAGIITSLLGLLIETVLLLLIFRARH